MKLSSWKWEWNQLYFNTWTESWGGEGWFLIQLVLIRFSLNDQKSQPWRGQEASKMDMWKREGAFHSYLVAAERIMSQLCSLKFQILHGFHWQTKLPSLSAPPLSSLSVPIMTFRVSFLLIIMCWRNARSSAPWTERQCWALPCPVVATDWRRDGDRIQEWSICGHLHEMSWRQTQLTKPIRLGLWESTWLLRQPLIWVAFCLQY